MWRHTTATMPVSYTHLDVYKRQVYGSAVSQIDVIPLKGTPQGEFWYLTRPLLTCLDALSGTVQLGAAQGGLLTISTEDAFYMQNGVRPPSEQQSSKAA